MRTLFIIPLVIILQISHSVFFPSLANAKCKDLSLNSEFLAPYETETIKWKVGETFYYKDPNLGFSIDFKSNDIRVDYYVYSLGIQSFEDEMIGQLLRQSVSEMLQVLNYQNDAPTSEPFLLPEKLFAESKKLVRSAVYVVQERKPENLVSIVSIGFDGNCFQKLRFTKRLLSKDIDIKTYFDNPLQNKEVLASVFEFSGLVKILNDELYRVNYFQ